MRKSLALAVATVSALGVGALVPAAANAAGTNTTVTFQVSGAGLSLSVPTNPTVDLAAATLSLTGPSSVSGALNSTKVSDLRGVPLATWTVGITGSGWQGTDVGVNDTYTIPANDGTVWLNATDIAGAAATGEVINVGQTATVTTPATISAGAAPGTTFVGAQTTLNTGSMTYTPQISVSIPTNAPAGHYSGTVTQTVS